MKKATVIIPNYNGIAYLEDCLKSLEENRQELFDVIVVDNGSTDGSERIAQGFGDGSGAMRVLLIGMGENTGFCRAVNAGIRAAETEYVILLNNDTRAEPDFVEKLVEAVGKEPEIFSAGARMMSMKEPDRIDDAGDFYCALGWAYARGRGKEIDAACMQPGPVFAACAGAAIYRREILNRIGLFDENHFAYLEDIDIGYRAKLSGYKNVYEPEAVVRHAGSAVSGSRHNPFKVSLSSRNSVYLVYKNMPFWQILLNFPFLTAGFALKALFFFRKGMGGVYMRGLLQGVKLCRSEQGVRRRVRGMRFSVYFQIQKELWKNISGIFF